MQKYILEISVASKIFDGKLSIPQVDFAPDNNIWQKIGKSGFAEILMSPKRVWCRNFMSAIYLSTFSPEANLEIARILIRVYFPGRSNIISMRARNNGRGCVEFECFLKNVSVYKKYSNFGISFEKILVQRIKELGFSMAEKQDSLEWTTYEL